MKKLILIIGILAAIIACASAQRFSNKEILALDSLKHPEHLVIHNIDEEAGTFEVYSKETKISVKMVMYDELKEVENSKRSLTIFAIAMVGGAATLLILILFASL